MNNQYNVLIDLVGAVLVSAILFTERRQKRYGDPFNTKLLHGLMLTCAIVFALDVPGLLLDGCIFPGAKAVLWTLDSAYWAVQIIYAWLWLVFADYWSFGSRERVKKRRGLYLLPMIIELAAVAINPFTGIIFTINENNVYERGSMYLPNMMPYALYIVGALTVAIIGWRKSEKPEGKKRNLSLLVYMFLPICGVCCEAFVYGISWVWPMVALSLLMVYMNVQQQYIALEQHINDEALLRLSEKDREATEARVAIMKSQLQPHFLFNALSVIRYMCREDTEKAEVLLDEFSQYLRTNIDSLTFKKSIPIEKELEYTRIYTSIETYRVPYVKIEFSVEDSNFNVPPITVQPLVDNAINYGRSLEKQNITVTVHTYSDEQYHIVEIIDDGAGFDETAEKDDGKKHIGIKNVRNRLSEIVNGTLEIQSKSGEGTRVIIRVPK